MPVRGALVPPHQARGVEVHAVLPPPGQGTGARVRRGLPDRRPHLRRGGAARHAARPVHAIQRRAGPETAPQHRAEGLLRQSGRGGPVSVQGYIYPNEFELQWGLLIVLYPYVTGLVAGAFILASLERVFNVKEVQPTYRLALLTALAFLLVAPLPLLGHLGHPERSYEIFLTPNRQSAMAMFGFVYAWYLAVVLLLEVWFEWRRDMVQWAQQSHGVKRWVYTALTLGSTDVSERALRFDDNAGRWITIIGIPSAFLLHGYVGFIFGSVKANPWWSSVLMPVVFLFSAIVSGIALVLILYMLVTPMRGAQVDMACLDRLGAFLFYAIVVDFSLEALDFIHRLYESEESISIL